MSVSENFAFKLETNLDSANLKMSKYSNLQLNDFLYITIR